MGKIEGRIRYLVTSLAVVALLAIPASLAAQSATEQEEQQEQDQQGQDQQEAGTAGEQASPETAAPAARAVPQISGTVLVWNGYRIDLKTPEGKTQQVAVNKETERLVEIKQGVVVTVEYHRKVGGFVIAERVLPMEEKPASPEQAEQAEER